jgi:hypothetical protein
VNRERRAGVCGSVGTTVEWTWSGADLDVGRYFYGPAGTFYRGLVSNPDLTLLEMCVYNSPAQTVTASHELAPAG